MINNNNSSQLMPHLLDLAKAALLERGFLADFSTDIQKEVEALRAPLLAPSAQIKDLRDKLWFSIDNNDSRDLDQLTYAESLGNSSYRIYVAIADVEILVKKNSAIDLHAQQNTTSLYTPGKVFPMLPEQLSTNLTSLNEKVDRQAVVVEVEIDAKGASQSYQIYQALVNNKAKLAYNSVASWLDTQDELQIRITQVQGLPDQLKLQDQIAALMRKNRQELGTLTLETEEAFSLMQQDKLIDLIPNKANRALHLIEDFMICANTAMARFLDDNHLPSIQRVVRTPKRWDRVIEVAQEYDVKLPEIPNAKALNEFLVKRKEIDPVNFPNLSLTIIKLLGNGEYVVKYPGQAALGHFDLAIKNYTHSTAPNRRFSDLITQRILVALLNNQKQPYTSTELETLVANCTQKEDDANKVERKVRKSAAILLLTPRLNEIFDAVVTGAGPKGTWVRINHPLVEGKLLDGFKGIDVGDQIRVKLVHLDLEQGFIDFQRVK